MQRTSGIGVPEGHWISCARAGRGVTHSSRSGSGLVGRAGSGAEEDAAADDWLIGKARGGDLEAYESLVRRHRLRAYRIALRILGDPEDAQDVTQDVFIQVWSSLAGFLGGSTFTTWLYRIVVNRCLNHRRRHRDTAELPDDHQLPALSGTDETVIARLRAEATTRAIAALPADQRSVFVLCQMEDLSYQEVAAILDVPEATVRGRLARARRLLTEQLQGWR
ncbi:RNA polymerase sigma factor [Cryptosporangium sp. NPDC048952]|uniref:RNA polymerase sigma factor n=1 Tax=Cryptosporangium sp. NPDC048952 TaxID=3363961 RepID=UPI003715599D